MSKTVAIIGAGPAGLTAALELLRRGDHRVLVFDYDSQVGGISKTVCYNGNRMDLGGHRFFSKSDWVMEWWQDILPIASDAATMTAFNIAYQGKTRQVDPLTTTLADREKVLLVRPRLSRIYYRRRFFDYPLKLNGATIRNLGAAALLSSGLSYAMARALPRTPEVTLEDFFINRFGNHLYRTFFKNYTEKVWGVACKEISAEWGAQRVKGLSISKAIAHALSSSLRRGADLAQKKVETSLIERFLYPRLGPGQMWEEVASLVRRAGGEIHLCHKVIGIDRTGSRITGIQVHDTCNDASRSIACDTLVSSMPLAQLTAFLQPGDAELSRVAAALPYRDFMTAGLVVTRMKAAADPSGRSANGMPADNWIYIQEPDVRLGRLQIFNNWSPDLVANPNTISLGLEYFCGAGDELWSQSDGAFLEFAAKELERIGLIDRRSVVDGTVVRVPKAYPAYFGEYRQIGKIRSFLDEFQNLLPIGRNGMHRYNNQDHSMLAAKAAVECILGGVLDKRAIWDINTEDDYHEHKQVDGPGKAVKVAA